MTLAESKILPPTHWMDMKPQRLSAIKSRLSALLGDRFSDAETVRAHHAEDEAFHHAMPDLVAFPKSTDEVASVIRLCAEYCCPVIAWGVGTSLEGNALASAGGLCLDLSQMDRIVELQEEDMTVTVQAGVCREALNTELRHTGLCFPIDPGANATLGGMAATRASGTNAIKYGTMRHNVLRCTVVLCDGSVIETGTRAPKSAAGYDLTALFVGSEGTLGIITELTIRLHPIPESTASVMCIFPSLGAAVETVILAIQTGLDPARIELMDEPMMAAINAYENADFAVAPTLAVEFHGPPAAVEEQMGRVLELVDGAGGTVSRTATRPEERTSLWKARHNALYATRALQKGKKLLITDVCVPISRLADCIIATRKDIDTSGIVGTIAGHVGDGNFHAFLLFDPAETAELEAVEGLHRRTGERAIEMGGTCTGEHGIGLGKQELLRKEAGSSINTMLMIKQALDPRGLFNPGKIFASITDEKGSLR